MDIDKITEKISLKDIKDFLVGPIPHVLLIISSIFVVFSIVYDRLISYTIVVFFYTVSINHLRLWYKDRIFFVRTDNLAVEAYFKKWKFWNWLYHFLNVVLIIILGIILLTLLFINI